MSKKRRSKDSLFGIFVIAAGLVIILAVTMVSRQSEEYAKDESTYFLSGSGGSGEMKEFDGNINSLPNNNIIDENPSLIENNVNQENPLINSEQEENTEELSEELDESSVQDLTLLQTATETTSGEITSYHFDGNNILNVMPISYKDSVLNESSIIKTEDTSIGGSAGKKYTITSAKDGSEINVIHVELNGVLYDFRGTDDFLKSLNNYILLSN